MKLGISALAICCAAPAWAREEVRRDFQKTAPLAAGRRLSVDSSLGNVNIRAQNKNELTVIGAIRCSADTAAEAQSWCGQIQIRVDESSAGITVRTQYPNHGNTHNLGWSVNLDIAMPEGAPLDVRNRFGGVTVQGTRAGAEINNSNGNIYLANSRGAARIQNAFGNVEVQTCDGDLAVTNGNGWVRATDVTGSAEIGNRFGEVRVTNAGKWLTVRAGNSKVDVEHATGPVNITTSFGDVRVLDAKGNVTVNDQNGRVEARTVAGAADLHTSFGSVKFSGVGKGVTVVGQNAEVTGDTVGESAAVQTSFANVDLRSVKGGARVTAGNSPVRLVDIGGEVYAKTSFGGVTVERAGGAVTVEDGNGSINVSLQPGQGCKPVVLHTSFAPIQLALPAGAKYDVTAKTSFGRIHSEHDLTVNGAIGGDQLSGKMGGGGCELRLTNQNGNIDILKR
ncbi:MAG TPA: hypothetical protein VMH28_25925 [Candidatus Acidoferrales bacterium]|nr:hypothetical protein [Candidatus Acidoferrales bacterium]